MCSLPQRQRQEAPGNPVCALLYPNTNVTSNTRTEQSPKREFGGLGCLHWQRQAGFSGAWSIYDLGALCKKENTKCQWPPNTTQFGGYCDRGEVWVRSYGGGLKWLWLKHVTFSNFTKVCGHVKTPAGPLSQGNPPLNKWLGSVLLKNEAQDQITENVKTVPWWEYFINIFDI